MSAEEEVFVDCLLEDSSDSAKAPEPGAATPTPGGPEGVQTAGTLMGGRVREEAHVYGAGEDYWEDDDWEAPKDEEEDEPEGHGDGEHDSGAIVEKRKKKRSSVAWSDRQTFRPEKRSAPTASRAHLWKSTAVVAPVGEEAEAQELADLNEKWAALTDSEKQSTHRSRMKWVAERLHSRLGTAPTITAMMRHVGYPLGRRMTITQIVDEVADAHSKVASWEQALKDFESQHINEKGKRQRVSRIKVKEATTAVAPQSRGWAGGRRLLTEPKGEQEEARELEDLQTNWASTSIADRAAVHYMRLKWVAARLSQRSGAMVTAGMLQPVGRSMGLSLTLTEMETGLLVAKQHHPNDWKAAVQEFVRSQAAADSKFEGKKRKVGDQPEMDVEQQEQQDEHEQGQQQEQIVDRPPKKEPREANQRLLAQQPAPADLRVSDTELAYALASGSVDAPSQKQQPPDK